MSLYSQCIVGKIQDGDCNKRQVSVCLSLFYYLFNKEIENRRNNYYCRLITTINTLRMLLILSIKGKNISKIHSHSRGEWSLIVRETHSHSKHV